MDGGIGLPDYSVLGPNTELWKEKKNLIFRANHNVVVLIPYRTINPAETWSSQLNLESVLEGFENKNVVIYQYFSRP